MSQTRHLQSLLPSGTVAHLLVPVLVLPVPLVVLGPLLVVNPRGAEHQLHSGIGPGITHYDLMEQYLELHMTAQ